MNLVALIICFALLWQTCELAFVPAWEWRLMKSEVPFVLRPWVQCYRFWLLLRGATSIAGLVVCSRALSLWTLGEGVAPVAASIAAPAAALIAATLLFSSWMIAMRWRGNFNGGSDYMTMVVLSAWFVSSLSPLDSALERACLVYIAIQAALSYVVAGWVKVARREWRSGVALSDFLTCSSATKPGRITRRFASWPRACAFAAWAVMLWECAFPLAWLNLSACLVFLAGGIFFHAVNVYLFGLNRFFWAWLATYPAILITVVHGRG